MSKLVSTSGQAIHNISHFSEKLDASARLRGRLSYARAWYGHRDDDGDWHFGPSKFCGYKNMTAEEYLDEEHLDGRQTEIRLSQWFTEVSEDDDLHEELYEGLTDFLAEYGKVPSSATRISVATELYDEHLEQGDTPFEQTVADLVIAVARRLPAAERDRVRATL